jgi:hypothetical protein
MCSGLIIQFFRYSTVSAGREELFRGDFETDFLPDKDPDERPEGELQTLSSCRLEGKVDIMIDQSSCEKCDGSS